MGVVVFDSDVLIGFLNRDDAHHADARELVRRSLATGTRRQLCTVNYAEILIGPLRAGVADRVRATVTQLRIELVAVDELLAARAADVRARSGLKLPDAFAVATAALATERGSPDVALASFDQAVGRAHAGLGRA